MNGDRRSLNLQAVGDGRDLLGELYAEMAKVERLESALRVISAWGETPRAMVAEHIIALADRALEDVRK